MSITPEIQALVDRLNHKLEAVERETTRGLDLVRPIIALIPDNAILIRFFASLNNTLLFLEISRRRIQITVNRISPLDVAEEEILEAAKDLGTELGRLLEAKMSVERIVNRLRELL
jgi:hypothetical protein